MTLERGALLHNRYRIIEILGQGGMGSVYRAVDENLGVDVAVKENLFTTDEYARQFRLEAVILANLRQQNLPRVTDHFVIGDQGQYLVMDYIEGEDLRQRMERTSSLTNEEVILIGAAMCKALTYLHSRQPVILHRDVKPGNVKITPDGEVFLVDFGLAKVVQGSEVTTTGARAMTPGYSPPEQYGTARTDPRTDIYSLGATLYAALTGMIPEDGLARAMENADLTPIRKRVSKVPRRLASAIEKAMNIDADDRFQKAEEFRKALLSASSKTQKLVEDDFTVAPSPSVPLEILDDAEKPEGENDSEIVAPTTGLPLPSQPVSNPVPTTLETPRQKRRKKRAKFIRFLLLMIFIAGSITALMVYFPQILDTLSDFGIVPTAIPTEKVTEEPTATAIPVREVATETPTLAPIPTETSAPTLTPTPTNTPTASPTPFGGGAGQLAFVSDRTGASQIYLINSDGSEEHPITNLPAGACQPDWAPDGDRLVFVSPCEFGQDILTGASLYLIDADGANLTQLPSIPGGDFEPAWAPDGKRIAFTSIRDGFMQIYAINLDDNSIQRLTETNRSSNEYTRQSAWSPFGNQIAYAIKRYGSYQIWTMTDSGESSEQLTQSGYDVWDLNPIWSPDGAVVLYDQHAQNTPLRVWLMSIRYENRGEAGVDVQASPLPVQNIAYSTDGFWLAFEGKEENNEDIFIMTSSGASRTRLTSDPATDYGPVWRPMP
ncbi:MAG: serine/threonine-protein kinase [Anaerolineae bacterium]|jgi:eukaryotic-like serine/threonine-protein kinase|nr:serine/threonine-protein kinase [Anaerolineae bacterium]MBT7076021.1 serine/threonine-protein kinase [Anaerolineae bacterium]MBT7783885.1 serine/threonine-protein kinase [Anaerolineae bacterium]